jgi:hypothetical protein
MAEDGDRESGDRERAGATRGETPRESVDELTEEDLTDLDAMNGVHVQTDAAPIERGTIDRENALFVVLGVLLSVLVFVEFLSVLPAG